MIDMTETELASLSEVRARMAKLRAQLDWLEDHARRMGTTITQKVDVFGTRTDIQQCVVEQADEQGCQMWYDHAREVLEEARSRWVKGAAVTDDDIWDITDAVLCGAQLYRETALFDQGERTVWTVTHTSCINGGGMEFLTGRYDEATGEPLEGWFEE